MAHITDYDVWHETEEAVNVQMLIENLMANASLTKLAIARLGALLTDERPCDCGQTWPQPSSPADLIPVGQDRQLRPIVGKSGARSLQHHILIRHQAGLIHGQQVEDLRDHLRLLHRILLAPGAGLDLQENLVRRGRRLGQPVDVHRKLDPLVLDVPPAPDLVHSLLGLGWKYSR